jgi:hypothetical protein
MRCDIDPKAERPEARAFDFDPVKLAQDKHAVLVNAALIMLRAYLFANKPWTVKRQLWGGFERWDALVCGCLTWLGMTDPYTARERIITDDPIRMSHMDILEDWFLRYGVRKVSFNEIRRDKGDVFEHLTKAGVWDGHHARWILRRLEGQTIGGYRLVRAGGRSSFRIVEAGATQGDIPYPATEENLS